MKNIPKTVYELYKKNPKRWTQGWWAKRRNGHLTTVSDPKAASFCLSGAITLVYGANRREAIVARRKFEDHICGSITSWNDFTWRTFAEVLETVRKAKI